MDVISSKFCIPNHAYLTIMKKPLAVTDAKFTVSDEKGNIVFKVTRKILSMHDRHVLTDAGGNPIVTLLKEVLSGQTRWLVFRGDSANSKHILFSAKQSVNVQKTELEVFVFGNDEEGGPDFKVVGSWLETSCTIFEKCPRLIATMHKKHTFGCTVLAKDTFHLSIVPGVDQAFIVALLVILYEMNKHKYA